MSNGATPQYDVVIIGAGVSGNLIAKQLGLAGKKVLILEAGLAVPDSREEYMNNFYLALAKTPEAPYPALAGRTGSAKHPVGQLPDPAKLPTPRATVLGHRRQGPTPATSCRRQPSIGHTDPKLNHRRTRRRMPQGNVSGFSSPALSNAMVAARRGTGSVLRCASSRTTFSMRDKVRPRCRLAGHLRGAAATVGARGKGDRRRREYGGAGAAGSGRPGLPAGLSISDAVDSDEYCRSGVSTGIAGLQVPGTLPDTPGGSDPTMYDVFVTPTPQGRNSEPYDDRRVCAGNTNCIPICPIQAKWDPTVTLGKALDTGNVTVSYQSVAYNVATVRRYERCTHESITTCGRATRNGNLTKVSKSVTGKIYVLACHAIENAKLLLLSNNWQGIANTSNQVGRNLMDHPLYLTWALAPEPLFGYRGPARDVGHRVVARW